MLRVTPAGREAPPAGSLTEVLSLALADGRGWVVLEMPSESQLRIADQIPVENGAPRSVSAPEPWFAAPKNTWFRYDLDVDLAAKRAVLDGAGARMTLPLEQEATSFEGLRLGMTKTSTRDDVVVRFDDAVADGSP